MSEAAEKHIYADGCCEILPCDRVHRIFDAADIRCEKCEQWARVHLHLIRFGPMSNIAALLKEDG